MRKKKAFGHFNANCTFHTHTTKIKQSSKTTSLGSHDEDKKSSTAKAPSREQTPETTAQVSVPNFKQITKSTVQVKSASPNTNNSIMHHFRPNASEFVPRKLHQNSGDNKTVDKPLSIPETSSTSSPTNATLATNSPSQPTPKKVEPKPSGRLPSMSFEQFRALAEKKLAEQAKEEEEKEKEKLEKEKLEKKE